MPDDPITPRAELFEAMDALHQARLAMVAEDFRTAVTKLSLAEAIIGEVRKKISHP